MRGSEKFQERRTYPSNHKKEPRCSKREVPKMISGTRTDTTKNVEVAVGVDRNEPLNCRCGLNTASILPNRNGSFDG